jgi:cobalt-zinc-cadmium efflux system outer membrane protein
MIWLLITFAISADDVKPATFFAGNEELAAYLLEAGEKNPGLRASYTGWQAALAEIPQATALDDPVLSFTQVLRSLDENAVIELEQKLPWFGVLRLQGNKAASAADARLAEFYVKRNDLFARVKAAYYDYTLLEERIRIVKGQAEILKYVEDTVGSKYSVGLAEEQELFQVQIEEAKLEDQYQGFLQRRPAVIAALDRLIGREPSEELPAPSESAAPPPPPPVPIALARLHSSNPALIGMQHMIEGLETGIALARKRAYPEVTLGLGYTVNRNESQNRGKSESLRALNAGRMFASDPTRGNLTDLAVDAGFEQLFEDSESMPDEWTIGVSVNVPVWRKKIKAGITQAQRLAEEHELERRDTALELGAQLKEAYYEYEDAARRLNVLKENLVPKAQLTYESAVTSYSTQAGSDFLEMLNSQRMLLEFQLDRAQAEHDLKEAAATLEMLMGGPWATDEPNPNRTGADAIDTPAPVEVEASPPPQGQRRTEP